MVGLGIYQRTWTSVTLGRHWCDLQWIGVMPVQRFAELMCVSNTTECNYMKMTLSDVWKNNFKGKLYHIRDILYPGKRKPALLICFSFSWCASDTWWTQIAAQNWDFLDVCHVYEVIYCWTETRKSIGHLPCEQKGHILQVLLAWNKHNKSIL